MSNPEYFLILCAFLAFALYIEFGLRLKVYGSRKERLWFTLITLVVGVIWDNFSLSRGHWVFPASGSLGLKIGRMPIEEYLFILIIPYALLATKAWLQAYLKRRGT